MKNTLNMVCLIFVIMYGNNISAQDAKIDMNIIIKNTEKKGAEALCSKGNLLSCLNVTKDQCMSEVDNIIRVCSSKYLHNPPDINSTTNIENGLDEIEKEIKKAGFKFGECIVNDYTIFKGVDKEQLRSCLTRSNKALQPTQKPRG